MALSEYDYNVDWKQAFKVESLRYHPEAKFSHAFNVSGKDEVLQGPQSTLIIAHYKEKDVLTDVHIVSRFSTTILPPPFETTKKDNPMFQHTLNYVYLVFHEKVYRCRYNHTKWEFVGKGELIICSLDTDDCIIEAQRKSSLIEIALEGNSKESVLTERNKKNSVGITLIKYNIRSHFMGLSGDRIYQETRRGGPIDVYSYREGVKKLSTIYSTGYFFESLWNNYIISRDDTHKKYYVTDCRDLDNIKPPVQIKMDFTCSDWVITNDGYLLGNHQTYHIPTNTITDCRWYNPVCSANGNLIANPIWDEEGDHIERWEVFEQNE